MNPPDTKTAAVVQPWEKFDWPEQHRRGIYRDWGVFQYRAQRFKEGEHYLDEALDLRDDDTDVLHYRSKCKRSMANIEGALADNLAASALNDRNAAIEEGISKCLYELNRFEDCLMRTHDSTRKFAGSYKVQPFLYLLDVLRCNFKDSLGKSAGRFILEHEALISRVAKMLEKEKHVDNRPLWKILKSEGKCDVLSILEEEEENLTPLQRARRERVFKVFLQVYFNKSWEDVYFMKALQDHPSLVLHQSKMAPILHDLSRANYDISMKFLKMLQSRSPWYNERMRRCPNEKVCKKNEEISKNRIQYATRRLQYSTLQSIREFRKKGDTRGLAKFVEKVMGDYVVYKSDRVMPWRLEFMSEVYHLLALSYCDRFVIPKNLDNLPRRNAVMILLRVHPEPIKEQSLTFVFGEKASASDVDLVNIGYKNHLARLEKRMFFAKHGIEHCYLMYEKSRTHLHYYKFDECLATAKKAAEVARRNNSVIWQFLSVMLICKTHAVMQTIERLKESLEEAIGLANVLKSKYLAVFLTICRKLNDAVISGKYQKIAQQSRMRKFSTHTLASVNKRSNKSNDQSYSSPHPV